MSAEQPKIGLSQDAAIVLALAETAIPFASTREDEAELPTARTPRKPGENVVQRVAQAAAKFAAGRRADVVATVDVLFAVFEVYGGSFDRALYIRGATREELLERLSAPISSAR